MEHRANLKKGIILAIYAFSFLLEPHTLHAARARVCNVICPSMIETNFHFIVPVRFVRSPTPDSPYVRYLLLFIMTCILRRAAPLIAHLWPCISHLPFNLIIYYGFLISLPSTSTLQIRIRTISGPPAAFVAILPSLLKEAVL